MDTEIRVSTESRPWRRKFSRRSSRDSNPRPFNHESGALTTELSPPGARLLLQSYKYPNLSEGADRVAGQLRGDKEYPFSGVTKSGRVWRKVPESDVQSVTLT